VGGGTNAPAPPELFAQFMGRTNVMYYDWEITEQALLHSRQMWQILDILERRSLSGTNQASSNWTFDMASHLGNTVTEVTLSTPNELTLVRKSHIGFTGFELVALSRWFDSPSFPFGYEPPPKSRFPRSKPRGTNTAKPLPAKPAVPPTKSR
jgi:hypothetical protein